MEHKEYLKEFIKYTSLNVIGMLGLSLYILADTFFISKGLGADGLTALNLAIPIYSFIHGSGLLLGMGGATKYSIYKGQGEKEEADIIFTNTLYVTAATAFFFFLAGFICSNTIARLLGADAAIFAMTHTYLRMILLFAPAFLLNDVMLCFVRNDGNPKLSMAAMLGGSLSNILLDYIFIFPFKMGIFGAVLATGMAPVISMVILSLHFVKKKNDFRLAKTGLYFGKIKIIASLGFPSLVTEVSAGVVMIVFNTIILGLKGNTGVAAYGVVANLSLVMTAVFTGIAQGVQPLVSRAYGYNDNNNIKQMFRYAIVSLIMLSSTIYLTVFWFAEPIAGIFNSENNRKLQEMAVDGLRLYFMAAGGAGLNVILSVFFTSMEKAAPAHLISLLRGLILIVPMAFGLSALWGITGVWLAVPVTELLTAIIGSWLYRRSHYQKKFISENIY